MTGSSTILPCASSSTCPFLFECIEGVCQHIPVLPPTVYTGFVYVLLGFGIMCVNIAGLSAGTLKVPFLMDLLNYPVSQATALSYPIATGAAIANFIQLVPKRHPTKDTSLIDFNMALILLPSVVFGSTLGVLSVKFIPALVQDIVLVIVFSLFALLFYDNWVQARRKSYSQPQSIQNAQLQIRESGQNRLQEETNYELTKQLQYQKTFHLRDILVNFLAFAAFQLLSSLVQGKIIKFKMCSTAFAISFPCFSVVYAAYAYGAKLYTCSKMEHYRRIGYQYGLQLDNSKTFYTLLAAGFVGGLTQGIVGVGSGNLMVIGMLRIGALQTVASATSGYSILFVSMASLMQAILTGIIEAEQIALFFGVAFFFGGILTKLGYSYLKSRPDATQKVLLANMCLCVLSVLGTIPSVILTAHYYGWGSLLSIAWKCT